MHPVPGESQQQGKVLSLPNFASITHLCARREGDDPLTWQAQQGADPAQCTYMDVTDAEVRTFFPVDFIRRCTSTKSGGIGHFHLVLRGGGGFLQLATRTVAERREIAGGRLAPVYRLEPGIVGYVLYRCSTALLLDRELAGRNCLLEALRAATSMTLKELNIDRVEINKFSEKIERSPLADPRMSDLDNALKEAGSPFRLEVDSSNGGLKWTALLQRTEGIYLVLVLTLSEKGTHDTHFIVIDCWRDLVMIGPGHGAFRVESEDKADEARCRSYFLDHFRLVRLLRVTTLMVAANRAHETKFNTPEHYRTLAQKHFNTLRKKMAK